MSEFTPGLSARHDAATAALIRAFPLAPDPAGFVVQPGVVRVGEARGAPRHFSPADPAAARPTAGWDPLVPDAQVDHPGSRIDPLAAAHAAGFAEGLAAAAVAAQAEGARDRDLIAGLAAALRDAGRIDRDGLARRLRQTVMTLVTRMVGEAGVSAERLAARIEAATASLADEAESALLRVHPDDVALLGGHLPATVFAVGDASVARGAFVLEAASAVVEDGPDLWLAGLHRAIDAVPLPPSPMTTHAPSC